MDTASELTREDLRVRYGVDSEFVRVKEIARITGIAPTTIYTRMREGEFPLPVRRVGDMPLVRVDHLLAWLNEPGEGAVIVVRVGAPRTVLEEGTPLVEPRVVDRVEAAMKKARLGVERGRARRFANPSRAAGA